VEYRTLGDSGLRVPVLTLGTGTFGGRGAFYSAWGATDAQGATRLLDICLASGLCMFDTADSYSDGVAEEVLGAAIKGRRHEVIVSTKAVQRTGPGLNDVGSSRSHLVDAVDASLRRLGTDYIDIFQLHGFDTHTDLEVVLRVLNDLVAAGKVRVIGCSNFSGWQLMKSLAVSDRRGFERFWVHQAHYSLLGRDYEWELMPLAADQRIATMPWSPLGWGRLTGKIGRNKDLPRSSRLNSELVAGLGPDIPDERLFRVTDALDAVADATGRTVPQVALRWLLQRPTVASVIIGARDEEQLGDNLGAVDWTLDAKHMRLLDEASAVSLPYPYWHHAQFPDLTPSPPLLPDPEQRA
jgi:aryl-alcohol dehydrogenase-like predicted oxidoreductase